MLQLGGVAAAGALLVACSGGETSSVGPDSPAVAQAEARRRRSGRTVTYAVTARQTQIDLGGPVVTTWSYGDSVPGPTLRAQPGDELRIEVSNGLPHPTSVHWHGVAVDNAMDGVPPVTQQPIDPGSGMLYHYVVPTMGTYWYHPHVGLQLDRGLYGPLLLDDPHEAGDYDVEFVVVLDDWIDGLHGQTPNSVYARLRSKRPNMGTGMSMGSGMTGSGGGPSSSPLGPAPADYAYPYYLINGKISTAPVTLTAKPGQRARIRLINAAAATAFQIALGGHKLTVTHTDGYPVQPVTVDTLVIGMAERYDLTVTLGDGAFPLLAVPLGAAGQALAVVRTGTGTAPAPTARPPELDGRMLAVNLTDLAATPAVQLPTWTPDVTHDLVLSGGMSQGYTWTINGQTYPDSAPMDVREGQRTRLRFVNRSMMFHPIHLHGHTFQVRAADQGVGPRKDTVNVLPMQTVTVDFVADNPGQWVVHCHNLYHQQAGMMSVLSYRM